MSPQQARHIEGLLRQVHEALCEEGLVRGGQWAFNGRTRDGRAVRHCFRLNGYERTGPGVERELAPRGEGSEPVRPGTRLTGAA